MRMLTEKKPGAAARVLSLGGLFSVVAVLVLLGVSVEAATVADPVFKQQKNFGTLPVKKTQPLVYRYTATTVQQARQQGRVNAAKIYWTCNGTRCTTSGPWPQPSVSACQNLAALVGPIKSFGRSGRYLNATALRQCNQQKAPIAKAQKSIEVSGAKVPRSSFLKAPGVKVENVANNNRAFFNRLPVDAATKTQLARGKQLEYQVLTNAFSGRSGRMELRTWRGQILLPDLRKNGRKKVIHIKRKSLSKTRTAKQSVWFIENPDKSLSKQILNGAGQLAGNLTLTRDGSVRIGLDLNGDKVADLYELMVSGGEHAILFSPVGRAAWEHFMNGGANPLCTPGAGSGGGSFAGGMISGADKTAMQVVCGSSSNHQSAGISAGGAAGGQVSGDPAGRATDAMCKGVLSRHRGRPGNPGMVMGNPAPEDREGFNWPRARAAAVRSLFHTAPDTKTDSTGQDIVSLLGHIFGGVEASVTTAVGDGLNAGAPHFVNEADRDLKHFEEWADSHPDIDVHPDPNVVRRACAGGSTSRYCGGSSNNGGGNASDPGPDQQTYPDAALYNMCQARARSRAMWDANTKDTSYVHQLCENPASQPNPAGASSSATLGGSYGSSITLASYCGQSGGQTPAAQTPGAASRSGSNGRNCGRTESPGTDGRCHGVGNQFNGGSVGSVNISYGAVIGFEPFNPGRDPDPR